MIINYLNYKKNPNILNNFKFNDKFKTECTICHTNFLTDKRTFHSALKRNSNVGPSCSITCANKTKERGSNYKCVNCDKTFYRSGLVDKNRIFCSRSCRATKNNSSRVLSNEIKNRISGSLLKYYKNNPSPINPNKQRVCEHCGKDFYKFGKFCSYKCYTVSGFKREASSRGGKKSSSLRVIRSKDEIELFNLVSTIFNKARHNHIILDGWDADIVIEDEKIAILWNGPWHYKEMGFKNHSLKQVQNRDLIKTKLFKENNWKVFIYEDRYYKPIDAFKHLIINI